MSRNVTSTFGEVVQDVRIDGWSIMTPASAAKLPQMVERRRALPCVC